MPSTYIAAAPSSYLIQLSQLPVGSKAYYYMFNNSKSYTLTKADELHLFENQTALDGEGTYIRPDKSLVTVSFPDVEAKILNQYTMPLSQLYTNCGGSKQPIGLLPNASFDNFIAFIKANINSRVTKLSVANVVEIEIKESSMHGYTFNGNGQLNQVPILAKY